MRATTPATVENARQCVQNARQAILRQYVTGDPDSDPAGWELACAKTPRPPQFADALDALRSAEDHLTNALDELRES